MEQLSKFIKELRAMNEGLSRGRFIALWAVAITFAAGYLIGNVPWDMLINR